MTLKRWPWLAERPIAHRGFHDESVGRYENTLEAIDAAAKRDFAIEIDVQISGDGVAMCFHDESLDRLTGLAGLVIEHAATDLQDMNIAGTNSTIPTLSDVVDTIAGRVPLFIELKSRFRPFTDTDLVESVARVVKTVDHPIACMSFDPRLVAALLRYLPDHPRGIVADGARNDAEWGHLDPLMRTSLATMGHWPISQPDFVAFSVRELPSASVTTVRWFTGVPVLTWTVRTDDDRRVARDYADQMIFEGFDPADAKG